MVIAMRPPLAPPEPPPRAAPCRPGAGAPLALAAALLALAACDADLDPQYRVTDLRLLAVRAEVEGSTRADAFPGDTLALEALVANPLGRAPLTVTWYGCPPRADELVLPCVDPEFLRDPQRLARAATADAGAPAPRVIALGAGEALSLRIPALGEPGPASVEAALGFVVRRALERATYRCLLYAELPVVAVAEAGGRRQLALKLLRVTPSEADLAALGASELAGAYLPNVNPEARHVLHAPLGTGGCAGGAVLESGPFPASPTLLCGVPASGSSQAYDQCGPDGPEPTVEDLDWQWYLTAGELPEFDGIGNATGGSVELFPPAQPFTLWAILRDGRGGETWSRFELAAP